MLYGSAPERLSFSIPRLIFSLKMSALKASVIPSDCQIQFEFLEAILTHLEWPFDEHQRISWCRREGLKEEEVIGTLTSYANTRTLATVSIEAPDTH